MSYDQHPSNPYPVDFDAYQRWSNLSAEHLLAAVHSARKDNDRVVEYGHGARVMVWYDDLVDMTDALQWFIEREQDSAGELTTPNC